ncbi:MAG: HEPN domain-containing protein [candidate division WOR-3 bacterium]|nr:HEPN domain-containing protein [candidate division WOR-3 bacterium]
MNQDFKQCLESNKIIAFSRGKELVGKELSIAQNDLSDAKAGFENQRYKWSTIQAYYAMFHAARALIYSRGYREKSHYCLAIALRALFADEGLVESQSVRDFFNAMNLREAADYEAKFSESRAKAVIDSAERFIEKAATILNVEE